MRIERQLEMPKATRTRTAKYPLEELNVGDAIVLAPDEVTKWTPTSLKAVARNYTERNASSHRFAVRKMEDGSVGIWRTA